MMNIKQASLADIPKQFFLAKYNICAEFDISRWAYEFETRGIFWWIWINKHESVFSKEIYDPINLLENPISTDRRPIKQLPGALSINSVQAAPLFHVAQYWYEVFKKIFSGTKEEFDGLANGVSDDNEFFNTPLDILYKKAGMRSEECISLLVNLSATDEQILKDLKLLLPKLRSEFLTESMEKNLTESKLRNLHEQQVLPYIDLTLWAASKGFSIPQHLMGELLFPIADIDSTDKVRRTTKPLAESMMVEATVRAMRLQASSTS